MVACCRVVLVGRVGAGRIEVEACNQGEPVVQFLGAADILSVLGKHHGTFPQEQRHFVSKFNTIEPEGSWFVLLPSVEIEPVSRTEVNIPRGDTLLENGGCHQVVADEELSIGYLVEIDVAVQWEDEE